MVLLLGIKIPDKSTTQNEIPQRRTRTNLSGSIAHIGLAFTVCINHTREFHNSGRNTGDSDSLSHSLIISPYHLNALMMRNPNNLNVISNSAPKLKDILFSTSYFADKTTHATCSKSYQEIDIWKIVIARTVYFSTFLCEVFFNNTQMFYISKSSRAIGKK